MSANADAGYGNGQSGCATTLAHVSRMDIFYHVAENEDVWVGRAWFAGTADLHLSKGPNHP